VLEIACQAVKDNVYEGGTTKLLNITYCGWLQNGAAVDLFAFSHDFFGVSIIPNCWCRISQPSTVGKI